MDTVQTLRQPTVYVVDDDPLVTESLGTALELETPWRIVRSNDPKEALGLMTTCTPDVVLSDFKMPQMDGLAFLAEVRRRFPLAVLMLLTGYSDKDSAIAAINQLAIWQYVEKPWRLDDLLVKVAQGIERQQLVGTLESRNVELAERVRLLEAAHDRLLRSEQLATVGRVIAGLGHEVGNQLSVVAYAELLAEQLLDAEHRRHAETIARTLRRLEALVQEVKDFVRGVQTPYQREPADFAAVVDEAVAVLRYDRRLQRRPLQFSIRARPVVLCHRGRVAQLVINLVKNALEASSLESEVSVSVDADHEHGGAILRVADRGHGLPDDVLLALGRPFFSTKPQGMGLGVGITQRIVAEHGGEIAFANRPDGGAEVVVRLPLFRDADEDSA